MFNRSSRGSGSRRGAGRGQGRGVGGGTRPGSGPAGNCICPKCGHKKPHQVGERCIDLVCPKCGTTMIRE